MNQAAARCRWLASRLPLLRFLDSAGVIVNNAPAFRKTLPDQRENSTNITRRARQMPMPEHQGGVVAEKAKLEAGKIELAHRGAIGIILLVAREHTVPPARNPTAPRKCQIRRMPIALQQCVYVYLVTVVLLRFKNPGDGSAFARMFVRSSGDFRHSCTQKGQ